MRPRLVAILEAWHAGLGQLVPGYPFMLALGAVLGALVMIDRAGRAGYTRRDTLGVLMIAYASGLAGGLAVPAGQAVIAWFESGRLVAPTGMAAYGGLVGGILGGVVALRRARLAVGPFLDAVAPGIGIGIFFTRIGCFLAGCDYGTVTASRFGTTFPEGSHAYQDHVARGLVDWSQGASLPVHPTQLYEAACGLVLFFVATRVRSPFVVVAVGYAVMRSVVEVFRGDASRGHLGVLSTAQVFALVTALAAIAFHVARRPTRTEVSA